MAPIASVFERPTCLESLHKGRSAVESGLDYRIKDALFLSVQNSYHGWVQHAAFGEGRLEIRVELESPTEGVLIFDGKHYKVEVCAGKEKRIAFEGDIGDERVRLEGVADVGVAGWGTIKGQVQRADTAGRFELVPNDITQRMKDCTHQWAVVDNRFDRRVTDSGGLADMVMHHPSHNATPTMHQEHASSQIQAYRNGIIVDTDAAARDHAKLVAAKRREVQLCHQKRETAKSLEGFLRSQALGLQKSSWTYCDPPGYFEGNNGSGATRSAGGVPKVDSTPSENFEKNHLMGIYETKGYRHPHPDYNVHGGWSYSKDFGDEYFGRIKGVDVPIESQHPRHSFLHSVDQDRLRGPPVTQDQPELKGPRHYNAKTNSKLKMMKKQHSEDMLNATTGWKRRERMLLNAPEWSANHTSPAKKKDWCAQEKTLDYLEKPIRNALSDEPYGMRTLNEKVTSPMRTFDYSHQDFVCGAIRGPGGVTGSFSDPRVTVSRTMSGTFWIPPDDVSMLNKSSVRVQRKFDHWLRGGRQYWAARNGEEVSKRSRSQIRESKASIADSGKKSTQRVFPLTSIPDSKRWKWNILIHSGKKQEEVAVEADPRWTVDTLLKKLITASVNAGLLPAQTVDPEVNREDSVWSLLENRPRGQSTTIERTATLESIGLESFTRSQLTRVGLAATLVPPCARSASCPRLKGHG